MNFFRPSYTLILTLLISMIASFNLVAVEKKEVKCHVSLYSGHQTIYFAVLPKSQSLVSIANDLTGKKILTVISAEPQQVFKVNECILAKKKFNNSQANYIESTLEL